MYQPKPLAALLRIAFATSALAASSFATTALAQQTKALDPVIVTANRQPARVTETLADVTVIERDQLEASGQSTLESVLARQPGIELSSTGSFGSSTGLFLRGTNSSHVMLLIDGMRVGSATSGTPTWSRLPTSEIERIEILRGPASALYGSDAIGGVIQVFTRRGDGPARISAEAGGGSYGTHSAGAGISGGQDGWRYALHASTFKTQGFNSRPWDKNANPDRDGFEDHAVSGRLSYAFAKGHEAGASFLYSAGENRYDSSGKTVDWRANNSIGSFNTFMRNAFTDNWTSTLTAGYSRDDQENSRNGAFSSRFRTEQRQFAWQNDVRTGLGTFLGGLERLEQSVDTDNEYTTTRRTINSILGGWRQRWDAHSAQINVRRDHNSQFGDKTTGALAYGYRFTPHWRANASYGTAFKAPTFNDLYYPLDDFGFHGNPNLQPETARNREAAIHYERGLHHLSLTGFHNRVNNLISWQGTSPINIGEARLEGATLAYEGQIGDFVVTAHYTNQTAKDAESGQRLARRARNYGGASIGQTVGAWDWRVELQASGNRVDYSFSGAPPKTLGGYGLTNLYGAYRIAKDWSLFARVNNLFDKQYVLADGYATPGLNAFVGIRYSPK